MTPQDVIDKGEEKTHRREMLYLLGQIVPMLIAEKSNLNVADRDIAGTAMYIARNTVKELDAYMEDRKKK